MQSNVTDNESDKMWTIRSNKVRALRKRDLDRQTNPWKTTGDEREAHKRY